MVSSRSLASIQIVGLVMLNVLEKNSLSTNKEEENEDIFSDINYICKSTPLIVSSLQKGLDVAQLPNGDVLITEVRVVNTQYSWDKDKQKLTKISQN